jgi:hypothetical protein
MLTPAPLEVLADCAPMNARLGADLAQGPSLGVRVGCTPNVHGATVTSLRRIGLAPNRDALQGKDQNLTLSRSAYTCTKTRFSGPPAPRRWPGVARMPAPTRPRSAGGVTGYVRALL